MSDSEQLQIMICATKEKLHQSVIINGQNSPKSKRLQKYLHFLQLYQRNVSKRGR